MTEIDNKVVQLLSLNKSIQEIASELNISEKQLYVRIRRIIDYGYRFKPNYYYDSKITYSLDKKYFDESNSIFQIQVPSAVKTVRLIAISDVHIGNVASDINLLNMVYDYAKCNNINIILNCGDLVEGVHTSDKCFLHSIDSQLEFLIKNYPYDKSINNYILFGNHDYHSIYYDGLDISKTINNARYDLIPVGYGDRFIGLKNDILALNHKLSVTNNKSIPEECKLILSGHGHLMQTKSYDRLYIRIPTLSNVSPDKTKSVIPGFVDLKICFDKGKIEFVESKHFIVTSKVVLSDENRCKVKLLFNKS